MAVGPIVLYTQGLQNLLSGQMNLAADNFNVVLVGSGYVPAINSDSVYSAVSAAELTTGAGYTVNGVTLGGDSLTSSAGTITATFANAVWTNFTAGPFRYAVLIHRASQVLAANDLLLAYVDLTGSSSTAITGAGGNLTIAWPLAGVISTNSAGVIMSGSVTETTVTVGTSQTTILTGGAAISFFRIKSPASATQTVWYRVDGGTPTTAPPSTDLAPGQADLWGTNSGFLPTQTVSGVVASGTQVITIIYR